jgi:uncharacterized repeat protein (TIGR03803 family)
MRASRTLLSAALIGFTCPHAALAQAAYQQLFSFGNITTLANPVGPPFLAADGGLYCVTAQGGEFHAGSVFVLRRDPSGAWVATTLHSFMGVDGRAPLAGVVQGRDGNLYGTTQAGGQGELGTVFKMTLQGAVTVLHSFTGPDGAAPSARLVQGPDDAFYGTTSEGGANGLGTLFKITSGGDFTSLNSYAGVPGQRRPPLTLATDGNFYGTAGLQVFRMTTDGTLTIIGSIPGLATVIVGLTQGSDGDLYGLADADPFGVSNAAFKMSTNGAYTLLHMFSFVGEGGRAGGELVQAPDGSFYGAAQNGGTGPIYGEGTLFRMTTDGTVTLLHDFSGPDGSLPSGGLTLGSAGLLYGVTSSGGPQGGGTVFEATTGGVVTTLHDFFAPHGGTGPWGDLLLADDGNFYGTTYGIQGDFFPSTAYRMTPEGEVTTLHAFTGGAGANPRAGLIQGADGDFYGTTVWSGSGNSGTVFKVSSSGELTTLHQFGQLALPTAALVQASDGDFYGTTLRGGGSNCGTVFRMTASGDLTTLHEFAVFSNEFGNEGCLPYSGLVQASDGSLYGTTVGKGTGTLSGVFRGTIYRITPGGQFESLVAFAREYVAGGLVQGTDGRLYGTTYGSPPFPGWGDSQQERVFAIGLDGSFTTLHLFAGEDGRAPRATLVEADGFFYGSTTGGGTHGFGTLFRISPSGQFETLHHFTGTDGSYPVGRLARAPDGSLYGTTVEGGDTGGGVAFRLVP